MFKLESRLKSLYPCLSLPHCLSLSFSSVPVPFYCKEKIKEALCFSQRIETRASSEKSLYIYKKNTLLLHCAHNNYILVLPKFLATSPPFSANSKNSIWVLLKTTINGSFLISNLHPNHTTSRPPRGFTKALQKKLCHNSNGSHSTSFSFLQRRHILHLQPQVLREKSSPRAQRQACSF